MVTCEECERKEADTDVLVEGEFKRLCSQCARMSGAVVVEKPDQQRVEQSRYQRPKVKQILSRMAGVNKSNYSPESSKPEVRNPYANLRIPASRKQVSLDDLREVKRAQDLETKDLNETVGQIEDVEAEVEQHKSNVSWFGRVMKIFKKEKKAEMQAQEASPGPAADSEVEHVHKVRVIDSSQ